MRPPPSCRTRARRPSIRSPWCGLPHRCPLRPSRRWIQLVGITIQRIRYASTPAPPAAVRITNTMRTTNGIDVEVIAEAVTDARDDAVFGPFQAALGLSGHDLPPMATTRSLDSVSPHRRPVLQCSKASKSGVECHRHPGINGGRGRVAADEATVAPSVSGSRAAILGARLDLRPVQDAPKWRGR